MINNIRNVVQTFGDNKNDDLKLRFYINHRERRSVYEYFDESRRREVHPTDGPVKKGVLCAIGVNVTGREWLRFRGR